MHAITVFDATGTYKDGEVLDEVTGKVAASQGVVVLPYSVDFGNRNAIAGFFRRAFGQGVKPSPASYGFLARGVLYVVRQERTQIHCAFRLMPTGSPIRGELRLAADTGGGAMNAGTLSTNQPVRLTQDGLGEPDAAGGWTVRTSAPLTAACDGLMGIGLYGNGDGVRVEWIAFSQAP